MVVFEHALFMLLLLVGLVSARPSFRQLTTILIVAGLLLALLPPFIRIPVPWDLVLALLVPLLFWQSAQQWLKAQWRVGWRELFLWILMATGLGAIFYFTGYLAWPGALLFGIVAASLLWRAVEPDEASHYFSQIGPLTLVFLLTEVAPAVETPNRYLGGLLSGAAVGFAVALLAIYLGQRLMPRLRGWVALTQVYLAYWLSVAIDVSAIAAALISIAVYTEFSLRRGNDEGELALPSPLNNWGIFVLVLGLFVFLGWQAHQPLSAGLLLEAGLGLVVGLLIAWVGRGWEIPGFSNLSNVWQASVRVGLFVFAALLLWPRNIFLEPFILAAALGLAVLMLFLSATLLRATESFQQSAG